MPGPRLALATLAATLLLAPAATLTVPAAAAVPPVFDAGQTLAGAGGAEPSLAIDTTTTAFRDAIYVSAIPGPNIWRSFDGGRTFKAPVPFDTMGPSRGGDDDVVVDHNGNVIVDDLNLSHALVQVSTDHAATFNTGFPTAYEDDRPWLAVDGDNVYVAYHDFVLELPVVCKSTDGGQTFAFCNTVFAGDPSALGQCLENTNPGRSLVVDPVDKSLNFMFSCSTAQENAAQPPYGPIHDYFLAKSADGGLTWTTYPIFKADTSGGRVATYGNFWSTLASDAAGNYYTVFAGTPDDNHPLANPYHVWMVVSRDHGRTWGPLVQVDHEADGKGTHVLSHIAATAPGQVDIVYYASPKTGEPNGVCGDTAAQATCPEAPFPAWNTAGAPGWKVEMSQSVDALAAHPSFSQVALTSYYTHYGELCTNGLICGQSDRTLLDYISVGVDCTGLAHVAYAGTTKADDSATVRVSNQTGGSRIAPPAACGPVAAGQSTPGPPVSPGRAPLPGTGTGAWVPAAALGLAGLIGLALVSLGRKPRSA
ncbi:MAG TPA: sialidase family protein [Candidatus Dormibacteraeota bacterium]|jgi:hypothetical protein|nr:sialidase family protein [Candidatus Dormibacteraeota bacterium]